MMLAHSPGSHLKLNNVQRSESLWSFQWMRVRESERANKMNLQWFDIQWRNAIIHIGLHCQLTNLYTHFLPFAVLLIQQN